MSWYAIENPLHKSNVNIVCIHFCEEVGIWIDKEGHIYKQLKNLVDPTITYWFGWRKDYAKHS